MCFLCTHSLTQPVVQQTNCHNDIVFLQCMTIKESGTQVTRNIRSVSVTTEYQYNLLSVHHYKLYIFLLRSFFRSLAVF